jgi:molybdopterin converting factor small subunit
MAIKIHLYGMLKQMAGAPAIMADATDTDGLIKEMAVRFPALENLTCLVAVDRLVIGSNTPIREGQEIALLPPYSGG